MANRASTGDLLPSRARHVAALLLAGGLLSSGTAGAASFDLGAANGFVALGLSGTFVNLHNCQLTGNVGVETNGTLSFASPSSVFGNIYVDASATVSQNAGTLHGSLNLGQSMAAPMNDALQAASFYAGQSPTQALGNVTSSRTVTGNGGLNVLSVGSINLSGDALLVLQGSPNDLFVLNVTGGLAMGGSAQIKGGPNVTPNQILINFIGTGSKLTTHVDNLVSAIVLAPERSVEFHSYNGQVIAGGASLKLMSGAQGVWNPPTPTVRTSWGSLKARFR